MATPIAPPPVPPIPAPLPVAQPLVPVVEATPVLTAPKSTLKKTIAIPGGLGLTKKAGASQEVASEKPLEEEVVPATTLSNAATPVLLTQALLDEAIFSVREEFRAANKNMELAILDQDIRVTDGELLLLIHGSIQEDIANKMKPELIGLLRKFSGATQLSIAVVQQEEEPDEKGKLYTSTDKLKFLREKHPALMELQRKFDLEADF